MENNEFEVTLHPDGSVATLDIYLRGIRIQRYICPVGTFPQSLLDRYHDWYYNIDAEKFNNILDARLEYEGITEDRARELYGRTG